MIVLASIVVVKSYGIAIPVTVWEVGVSAIQETSTMTRVSMDVMS